MSDKYIKQEENIKDCPFCGSSVSVERVPLKHYKGCVTFEIKCLNCGCERTLMKNDSVYRTEEEARANAIAQWNERPSTVDVKRENKYREQVEFDTKAALNALNCNRYQMPYHIYSMLFDQIAAIGYTPNCGADMKGRPEE